MLRKSLGKLLLFVLLTSVVATGVIKLGWAQPTEITVVNPQTGDGNFIFCTNETTIGKRFNATVWLYNVTDLFMYQVMLNVDDTLLNITNAWCPTWDPQWVFQGKSTFGISPSFYDIDEDGYVESVLVGATLLFGETSFTGDGTLATIEFEIVYAPTTGKASCSLDIDNEDTFLVDSDVGDILTAKTSGYYEYVVPAIIYVEPAEVIEPTLVPSSYFGINITIANATDVYSFEFNLSYDPTVLNAVDAALGNFFPPTVEPHFVINNTAGYLFFSASLTPTETPVSGSGILAVITFHVEGLGATALDLYDTELADESGDPLPHTAEDGFFNNIKNLAILNVTVNPNITYVGWPVNITVVAENQGMDPETFEVSVYWNDTNLIAKETFTVDPNATITHTFTWNTTNALVCHNYNISAQATILPFELDTLDNKRYDGYVKIKIMGDINGDGKVDIITIDIAAQALGSYPGHPRWNPEADLNRDGEVDIVDLAMVAGNFGKTCSS